MKSKCELICLICFSALGQQQGFISQDSIRITDVLGSITITNASNEEMHIDSIRVIASTADSFGFTSLSVMFGEHSGTTTYDLLGNSDSSERRIIVAPGDAASLSVWTESTPAIPDYVIVCAFFSGTVRDTLVIHKEPGLEIMPMQRGGAFRPLSESENIEVDARGRSYPVSRSSCGIRIAKDAHILKVNIPK
jgi:hypothetical protein